MSEKKSYDITPPPDQKDIRITFLLKGEEAMEFKRWVRRQNLKSNHAGKILVIEGMKKRGILPSWWR